MGQRYLYTLLLENPFNVLSLLLATLLYPLGMRPFFRPFDDEFCDTHDGSLDRY